MTTFEDTIAAIATAPGEGGVAIVRISGPNSLNIADDLFRCARPKPSSRPSHVILHGHVRDSSGDLDEALLLIMRSPQSYTAEDVIEIQCHGGSLAARRILRRVVDAGARLAEPGEFTKRAFLNGRMDLVQAEAVLDIVRARSERAAAAALDQLEGKLSERINALYDQLMSVTADIEATLDFPEDELPATTIAEILARLAAAEKSAADLLSTWDEGHLLRAGALVVIAGKPNVGKSTLLNGLLGRPRAIVSHLPGTTRDTIEEGLVIDGIPIRLVDTAGLRDAESEVEQEGIRRTIAHIEKADLHLYVLDASRRLAHDDTAQLGKLSPATCVVVLNKVDLGTAVKPADLNVLTCVQTCLVRGTGVEDVRDAIRAKLESNIDVSAPPHAVISERHRQLLRNAQQDINMAIGLLKADPEEAAAIAASHLRSALEAVGSITGRVYQEELLANIFSRFCIGK